MKQRRVKVEGWNPRTQRWEDGGLFACWDGTAKVGYVLHDGGFYPGDPTCGVCGAVLEGEDDLGWDVYRDPDGSRHRIKTAPLKPGAG
jgi:hypothetical protein